ncbi:MAG: RDD family protein [Pyrinomonadaceae bacterium MAG19_C2-C3]|nr:RDD family protein [Pyrinomonadaceae bacterium MAG19_C2-C3]
MSHNLESETTPPDPNHGENFGYSATGYANSETAPAEYATFGQRLLALIVDSLIIAFAYYAIVGILSVFGFASFSQEDTYSLTARDVEGLLIGWLYEAVMMSSHRQGTFGKMAFGIKVTDMNGNRISFGRATARHFAKYISGVICLAGYFVALFTQRKQALHDLIAGTLVLK